MEQVEEINEFSVAGFDGEDYELLIMDGYDDCVEGIVERFGMNPIVCYDKEKVLNKLRKDMSEEEAYEWFEFNQIGAWLGDATPCFLTKGEKS